MAEAFAAESEAPVIGASEGTSGRASSRAEFEEAAMPHLGCVHRVAQWMARSPHDAEDLTQETYLRAFRSFHQFRPDSNCRAWLLKILSNLNVDRVTRGAARSEKTVLEAMKPFLCEGEGDGGASAFEARFDYRELLDDDVKQAVEEVPAVFRVPLLLSAVEEMTYQEVSRALGCPMGTVMSRIHRGRRLLKQRLAGYTLANGCGA